MPFWFSVLVAIAGMMYFRYFLEAVILFLLGDLLYGAEEPKFFGITFVLTLLAIALLASIEYLKTRLKYYPKKFD